MMPHQPERMDATSAEMLDRMARSWPSCVRKRLPWGEGVAVDKLRVLVVAHLQDDAEPSRVPSSASAKSRVCTLCVAHLNRRFLRLQG
jgi:hypothetical protein